MPISSTYSLIWHHEFHEESFLASSFSSAKENGFSCKITLAFTASKGNIFFKMKMTSVRYGEKTINNMKKIDRISYQLGLAVSHNYFALLISQGASSFSSAKENDFSCLIAIAYHTQRWCFFPDENDFHLVLQADYQ